MLLAIVLLVSITVVETIMLVDCIRQVRLLRMSLSQADFQLRAIASVDKLDVVPHVTAGEIVEKRDIPRRIKLRKSPSEVTFDHEQRHRDNERKHEHIVDQITELGLRRQ